MSLARTICGRSPSRLCMARALLGFATGADAVAFIIFLGQNINSPNTQRGFMKDRSPKSTQSESAAPASPVAAWMISRCVRSGPAAAIPPSTDDSKITQLQLATWRQRSSLSSSAPISKPPSP